MTDMDREQAKLFAQLTWPRITLEHTLVADVSHLAARTVHLPKPVGWPIWFQKVVVEMTPTPGSTFFRAMGYNGLHDVLAVRLH